MAIFRCNKCGHLREVSSSYVGKSAACPKCQNPVMIYDTVVFVQKVLEKYATLRAQVAQPQAAAPPPAVAGQTVDLSDIDIHNSTAFADEEQYAPIVEWFKRKQIDVEVDHKAVDTTGFFDEIALALGNNYALLKEVSEKIARTQRGGYTSVTLNLSNYSQKDAQTIQAFCKEMYEYAFIVKSFYKKEQKRLHLTLQTAPAVTNFFNGEWLEWYVFIKLATLCRDARIPFSVLRSLDLTFPNEDHHELDLFFLLKHQKAVCIECKSGEFRPQIEKYTKLRQRLRLDKDEFWLVVVGLDDVQAKGLSTMYDLKFYNESSFVSAFSAILT